MKYDTLHYDNGTDNTYTQLINIQQLMQIHIQDKKLYISFCYKFNFCIMH
jgi:hypothetical protein